MGLGKKTEEAEVAQSWPQIGNPDVRCSSLEEKVLQRRFLQRGYILWEKQLDTIKCISFFKNKTTKSITRSLVSSTSQLRMGLLSLYLGPKALGLHTNQDIALLNLNSATYQKSLGDIQWSKGTLSEMTLFLSLINWLCCKLFVKWKEKTILRLQHDLKVYRSCQGLTVCEFWIPNWGRLDRVRQQVLGQDRLSWPGCLLWWGLQMGPHRHGTSSFKPGY